MDPVHEKLLFGDSGDEAWDRCSIRSADLSNEDETDSKDTPEIVDSK